MCDGLELIYDDESGTWSEAPETYGSIAFETQKAFEEALDILNNSKWISFKEQQPQDGGFYLTYYAEHIHVSQWFPSKNWYNEYGGNVSSIVEYWKPLPEPPKAIKG